MNSQKIIGIILIKNEDIFIRNVINNILHFCDKIIIADNNSEDETYTIAKELANRNSKISLSRVCDPKDSHKLIECYAGTNTWIFGVDGDEIYDPCGLETMKQKLSKGDFNKNWCIYGNVLNCISIDRNTGLAEGYLAPPSRSMTKLYNFSLIESWTNCPQRLHSGNLKFKNHGNEPERIHLYKHYQWENAYFRCVHATFIPRSSYDNPSVANSRPNPSEIKALQSAWKRKSYFKYISKSFKLKISKNWKYRHYRHGSLVTKNIAHFLDHSR